MKVLWSLGIHTEPLALPFIAPHCENCKGLRASLKLSHTAASSPSLPPSPGLCGSMNFDEASEQEDDVEEDRTRSLSPHADTTRPASAASGKDTPVSRQIIPLAVKLLTVQTKSHSQD